MSDYIVKFNIMNELLEKKFSALEQIHNICENEYQVYLQPHTADRTEMLKGLSYEKQKLIDNVIKYDTIFQKTFDTVKEVFDDNSGRYTGEIGYLQLLIKQVMDLDVKIRSAESRNKDLVANERKLNPVKIIGASRDYILKQYEKNNKRRDH